MGRQVKTTRLLMVQARPKEDRMRTHRLSPCLPHGRGPADPAPAGPHRVWRGSHRHPCRRRASAQQRGRRSHGHHRARRRGHQHRRGCRPGLAQLSASCPSAGARPLPPRRRRPHLCPRRLPRTPSSPPRPIISRPSAWMSTASYTNVRNYLNAGQLPRPPWCARKSSSITSTTPIPRPLTAPSASPWTARRRPSPRETRRSCAWASRAGASIRPSARTPCSPS